MTGAHVAYYDPTTPSIRIGCPALKLHAGSRGASFNPTCRLYAGETVRRINRTAVVRANRQEDLPNRSRRNHARSCADHPGASHGCQAGDGRAQRCRFGAPFDRRRLDRKLFCRQIARGFLSSASESRNSARRHQSRILVTETGSKRTRPRSDGSTTERS